MNKQGSIIDRKYIGVVAKTDGTHVTDWIIFRAQDKLVPDMIRGYMIAAVAEGCDVHHLEGMRALLDRVIDYQRSHHTKLPDTTSKELLRDNANKEK